MSFTDDERKRIEEEEQKVENEIRSKFQSMFSKEELEEAEKSYRESEKKENKPYQVASRPVEERKSSGRVVKKIDVDADPISGAGSVSDVIKVNRRTGAGEEAPARRSAKETARQTERRTSDGSRKSAEKKSAEQRAAEPEKQRRIVKKTAPEKEEKAEKKPSRNAQKKRPDEKKRADGKKQAPAKKRPDEKKRAEEKKRPDEKKRAEEKKRPVETKPAEEKKPVEKKESAGRKEPTVRIKGPEYSLSGHKILTDSNYEEYLEPKKPVQKKDLSRPEYPDIPRYPVQRDVVVPETYAVARGIQWFRQDIIPPAGNEITRSDGLNSKGKVRSRARKVERAGERGTRETLRGVQVSVFSPEARMEASIVPERYQPEDWELRDCQRSAPRSVQHQVRIRSVDNSKKKRKQRLKQNKPKGPGGKIAVLILVLLAIAICVFGYITAKNVFDDAAMDPDDLSKIEYTVYEGTTDEEVGEFLESHGMVESVMVYRLRAKIFDADYVAGTYELSPSYSTEKIINILSGFDYSSSGS